MPGGLSLAILAMMNSGAPMHAMKRTRFVGVSAMEQALAVVEALGNKESALVIARSGATCTMMLVTDTRAVRNTLIVLE